MPPSTVRYQPALAQAKWTKTATGMVKVYKAPIENADTPAIVTDLASLKVTR